MERPDWLCSVRGRSLAGAEGGDFLLDRVAGLSQLRELDMRCMPATQAGLNRIEELTKLQKLNLYFLPVTDAGLDRLKRLSRLQELDLGMTKIDDAGLNGCRQPNELAGAEPSRV